MNLIEGLLAEIDRVEAILPYYDEIPTGVFAAAMIRSDVETAKRAIGEGDTVKMLLAYQALREVKE